MSLASANGPSVTAFCLPFTSLPVRSRGWPWSLIWPFSPSPFSQVIHFCITCCISAGDPSRDPPRYKNTNSLIVISPVLGFLPPDYRRSRSRKADSFLWGPLCTILRKPIFNLQRLGNGRKSPSITEVQYVP